MGPPFPPPQLPHLVPHFSVLDSFLDGGFIQFGYYWCWRWSHVYLWRNNFGLVGVVATFDVRQPLFIRPLLICWRRGFDATDTLGLLGPAFYNRGHRPLLPQRLSVTLG